MLDLSNIFNKAMKKAIDVMQNGEDFWIIDMALAKDSALLSCVPKDKIKAVEEDWIPRISIKEL